MLFKKNKIEGIIGFLGLEKFWNGCTEKEQESLTKYWKKSTGDQSPIKGVIKATSERPLQYLSAQIDWALEDKNYPLIDKIYRYGLSIISKSSTLDAHFFYQGLAEAYYKQRDITPNALDRCIEMCIEDIKIFPKYKNILLTKEDKRIGMKMPAILTFQRLAIIYEKNGDIDKAIDISNKALKSIGKDMDDKTKDSYERRIERLKKKL